MRYLTLAAFAGAVALSVGCGGSKAPDSCIKMLECDEALAIATDQYTQVYGGLDDENYGDGGSCYKGDKDACDAACESAVDSLEVAAEGLVSGGIIEQKPDQCE